jgi:hypothetical protein
MPSFVRDGHYGLTSVGPESGGLRGVRPPSRISGFISGTFLECAPQCGAALHSGDKRRFTRRALGHASGILPGALSQIGIALVDKDEAATFLFRKPIRGRFGRGQLRSICPKSAILAGCAELRCGTAWVAIAAALPLALRRAGAAPATPAQLQNVLHHARWGSATTLPPVAFARASIASRSI